jgi:hypothetical protein
VEGVAAREKLKDEKREGKGEVIYKVEGVA